MASTGIYKSFTLLLHPFRLRAGWQEVALALSGPESMWQRSDIRIEEHFLFAHVEEFFNYNAGIGKEDLKAIDLNQCVLFELKPGLKNTHAGCSAEKLFSIPLVLSSKDASFSFRFFDGLKQGLLSPKLMIVPQAGVGLLSFCLTLDSQEAAVDDLVDFNYACRNLYRSAQHSAGISFRGDGLTPQIQVVFDQVAGKGRPESPMVGALSFTFHQLVAFLLQDFLPARVEALSPRRFHVFSFLQTRLPMIQEELNTALFYLSRVYNRNYQPPFSSVRDNPEVIQTFRDIYAAISTEGGCIVLNGDADRQSLFFENYRENTVKNRYIWIYMLAYLQRTALINTAYTVSSILKARNYALEVVSGHIQSLSRVQVRSMFSEISNIHMHNAFYTLCRNSFQVPALFEELKNELFDLNLIAQQQYEFERQAREKEEMRLEREVEQERRKAEERSIYFESRLNLILFGLGVLTLLSVWKDFADIISDGLDRNELIAIIELLAFVALILVAVYVFRSVRSGRHK